jgi:flagellar motor protein MotB
VARKKKHPEHVNHERWLVSYADFITLLFAFFVVMFAASNSDQKKGRTDRARGTKRIQRDGDLRSTRQGCAAV